MSKLASIAGVSIFVGVWVLWPFAMYGSQYVFSKQVRFDINDCGSPWSKLVQFFTGWIVMCIIYAFFTFLLVTLFPLINGWRQLLAVFRGVTGKKDTIESSPEADDGSEMVAHEPNRKLG